MAWDLSIDNHLFFAIFINFFRIFERLSGKVGKSSASFTATAPNKPAKAATFAHVRRFPFCCKVIPFMKRRHTGRLWGLFLKS